MKQTNKQTNKQANQTNEQTNKQNKTKQKLFVYVKLLILFNKLFKKMPLKDDDIMKILIKYY